MKKRVITCLALIGFFILGQGAAFAWCPECEIPSENMILHYLFNGNAVDSSGYGYDGIVQGAVQTFDRFLVGNSAYGFDGSNNDMIIANGTENLDLSGEWTISAWIFVSVNPVKDKTAVVNKIGPDNGGYRNGVSTFLINSPSNSNDYILFGAASAKETSYFLFSSNTSGVDVEDGRWHHVVSVYKHDPTAAPADGRLWLFVDGRINNVKILNDPGSNLGEPIRIGIDISYLEGLDRQFQGSIDDVRVFNTSLSECQVQKLYLDELNTRQQ